MIDHTGVKVSDIARSKAFYRAALAPIGYQLLLEFPAAVTGSDDVAGFGVPPKADFRIAQGTPNRTAVHVGACVLDPDGHSIELVRHERVPAAPGRP